MKKIVIASDSFKGSLTSTQVAESCERGVLRVFPDCEVIKIPVADGGEGTIDALMDIIEGKTVEVAAHDPLMRPLKAPYIISSDSSTAFIEMASTSGLILLAHNERNPMITTTYGTGELIMDAIRRGCRKFIIGIGGSATNDGGTGILSAMGYRFLDNSGNELHGSGGALQNIFRIDDSNLSDAVKESEFIIAGDVKNPFCGPDGAAQIYAPQKGASKDEVHMLDKGLEHFASVINLFNGIDIRNLSGAGAAGGVGGGLVALINARLTSGIELILELAEFGSKIEGVDIIITGEGKLDAQTIMGKVPHGVLSAARKTNIRVVAIGGGVESASLLKKHGFDEVISVTPPEMTLEEAMKSDVAMRNIENAITKFLIEEKNKSM